jgi:phenylacetic acid degradation protein
MVHGAHVGRNVLIGMMATVSDGADLGEDCVVGAAALVPAGMAVPPRSLVVGVPARVVGEVRPSLAEQKRLGTIWYQELARRSLEDVKEVELRACLQEQPPGAAQVESGPRMPPPWRAWIEETELFRPPVERGGAGGGS